MDWMWVRLGSVMVWMRGRDCCESVMVSVMVWMRVRLGSVMV